MKLKVWPLIKNLIALIESQEEDIEELMAEIAGLELALVTQREANASLAQELQHRVGNDLRPWGDGVPWAGLEGEPKP